MATLPRADRVAAARFARPTARSAPKTANPAARDARGATEGRPAAVGVVAFGRGVASASVSDQVLEPSAAVGACPAGARKAAPLPAEKRLVPARRAKARAPASAAAKRCMRGAR